jgi:hypothetical protein
MGQFWLAIDTRQSTWEMEPCRTAFQKEALDETVTMFYHKGVTRE